MAGTAPEFRPCPGRVPIDTKHYVCPDILKLILQTLSGLPVIPPKVDVLEQALGFRHYFEHKTILVLIIILCHAVLPHPPQLMCLSIIAEINGCGHRGAWSIISVHVPNMSRFSDSQTWQLWCRKFYSATMV